LNGKETKEPRRSGHRDKTQRRKDAKAHPPSPGYGGQGDAERRIRKSGTELNHDDAKRRRIADGKGNEFYRKELRELKEAEQRGILATDGTDLTDGLQHSIESGDAD
jgi:hypothetical protein